MSASILSHKERPDPKGPVSLTGRGKRIHKKKN